MLKFIFSFKSKTDEFFLLFILFLALLFVKALLDFFFVPLLVQVEEPR